jgi:hypothetical protein
MDYPFRKSRILCCSVITFLEPRVSQFRAMKETNNKNLCCLQVKKYLRVAQKLLLLFCAAHRNKQKYFDAFSLLWDDTKSTKYPGRAGFAKARYMKSFSKKKSRNSIHLISRAMLIVIGQPVGLTMSNHMDIGTIPGKVNLSA